MVSPAVVPIGRVTTTAAQFNDRIAAIDRGAMTSLASDYRRIMLQLGDDLQAVNAMILSRQAQGLPTPVSWLHRQQRYSSLILQANEQFSRLAVFTQQQLDNRQLDVLYLAGQNGEALLEAYLPNAQTLLGSFNSLPERSIQELRSVLDPGGPVSDLLNEFGNDAASIFEHELVTGLAKGIHPDQITRNILRQTDLIATRAATITRTELYRSFREGTRGVYAANPDICDGWIWFAHRGSRTCAACLAMHGQEFPVNEPMGNHPNCRCTLLPKTKTWAELGFPGVPETRTTGLDIGDGEAWLKAQPRDIQLRAFGNRKLWAGWDRGEYGLRDVVRTVDHPEWGRTRTIGGYDRARQNALRRAQTEAELARERRAAERRVRDTRPAWVKRAQMGVHDPAALTEADINVIGGHIQKQIDKRLNASPYGKLTKERDKLEKAHRQQTKRLYQLDSEMAEISNRVGYTRAVSDPRYRELESEWSRIREARDATRQRFAAVRDELSTMTAPDRIDVTRQVLNEFRPGYGQGRLTLDRIDTSAADQRLIDDALRNLPKEWVDSFNASGRRLRTRQLERAHFDPYEQRVGVGNVEVNVPLSNMPHDYRDAVATHELVHFAEYTRPALRRAEDEFYARRTAGETLQWMGPPYRSDEVTKYDQFLEPYMGKYYNGAFYELATMGVQNVFERGYYRGFDLTRDPDMYRFILGVLGVL